MLNEPPSDTTPSYPSPGNTTPAFTPPGYTAPAYPYGNFPLYYPVPSVQTPPPPPVERHKNLSLFKIFFVVISILALMAFSGLGGYLAHGMESPSSQRLFPTLTPLPATTTPGVNFNATATAITRSSDANAKSAYNSGYQAGYASGKQDGYAKGYNDGIAAAQGSTTNSYQQGYNAGVQAAASQITSSYNQGKQDGYNSGYTDGYNKGKLDGYNAGYSAGYNKGYIDGENAELTTIINWLETKCTRNASGYYPYVYISNGQLYCQ